MIAHLVYDNDLLLLSREDISSVLTLSTCLKQFGEKARLHANVAKSSIYGRSEHGSETTTISTYWILGGQVCHSDTWASC